MPEEFSKSFESLIEAFTKWLACIRNPSDTCQTLLDAAQDEPEATTLTRALKLWGAALLLSIPLQGWAYQLYGIKIDNIGFYLTSAVFMLAIMATFVFSIHCGFLVFKLSVPFRDTFVGYTVFVSAFFPIYALFFSPSLAVQLDTLKAVKSDNGLESPVTRYISLTLQSFQQPFGSVASVILVVSMLAGGVFAFAQLAMLFGFFFRQMESRKSPSI